MKTCKQTTKGFTLIELIVTLAILSTLLAISVPSYMEVKIKSEFRGDLATLSFIEKAEDHYLTINTSHSFDESIEQNASTFQDSLTNLSGLIDEITFQQITNVHWTYTDDQWQLAFDKSTSENEEPEEPELPDYPEWNSNQDHYNGGDLVLYNGGVFEALYWTNSEPGSIGNPWNEITDEWRTFNQYDANSIVTYNGAQFKARSYINPGAPSPGNLAGTWDEITDEWRNFNVYQSGSTVEYNGHTYRAKWYTKNERPGTASVWALIN